jgi:D-alanyl-D-alanine carboxypeptidase
MAQDSKDLKKKQAKLQIEGKLFGSSPIKTNGKETEKRFVIIRRGEPTLDSEDLYDILETFKGETIRITVESGVNLD